MLRLRTDNFSSGELLNPRALGIVICLTLAAGGCGKHPPVPKTVAAINATPTDIKTLRLAYLPLEYYPALRRFTNVVTVNFMAGDGPGANDQKLEALGNLPWKYLKNVNLQNCSTVTDTGILSALRLGTITSLGLEGTSVTDAGLKIATRTSKLEAVNVQGCKNVTLDGVRALSESPTMRRIGFSSSIADEAEIVSLLQSSTNVTWYIDSDPGGMLDADRISRLANVPRGRLLVKRDGAYR